MQQILTDSFQGLPFYMPLVALISILGIAIGLTLLAMIVHSVLESCFDCLMEKVSAK